jgi:hypothetical protein
MQFQPYKGGGGPDFLSLALSLRQQRNREESQKRRDEAALIRAESQAKNDELTRAKDRLAILKTYQETLAGASQTAQAAGQMGDERLQRAPEFLTSPDFQGPLQAPDQELQQQFPTPESFAVTQYPEYQTLVNRRANQLIQGGVDPAMALEQAVRDLDVQQRVTSNERQRLLDEEVAKEEREAASIKRRAIAADTRLERRQERARKATSEQAGRDKLRDARLAAYTPERFDIAAGGFATELKAAPDDDSKNAILAEAEQYAVEVAGVLEQDVEVVRKRLNRRMDGALAARDLEIKDEQRAARVLGGSPEQVEASVGSAADILEQQAAGNLSASQQVDLAVALGELKTNTVAAIAERRGITTEKAEEIYKAQLDAASAGRLREREKEDRKTFSLMRRVSNATTTIDRLEGQLEKLGDENADTPEYRALQRRLTDAVAVKNKLLSENLAEANPALGQSQFMQQDVGLLQTVSGIATDLRSMEQLAQRDPAFLGSTSGGLTEFLIDSVNKGTDIGRVFLSLNQSLGQGVKQNLLADTTIDEKVKQRLMQELGFDAPGLFQRSRTDAKILVSRMAYAYTRMLNPGRFSDAQYRNNLALFDFTEGSSQKAMTKLRAGIAEMAKAERQLTDRVTAYNPSTTRDADGNIRDAATYRILIRAPEAGAGAQAGGGTRETVDLNAVDAALKETDL